MGSVPKSVPNYLLDRRNEALRLKKGTFILQMYGRDTILYSYPLLPVTLVLQFSNRAGSSPAMKIRLFINKRELRPHESKQGAQSFFAEMVNK